MLELIKNTPKGGLHNPYNDDATTPMKAREDMYFNSGCGNCHGGGGGGMCPPLTNETWVFGGDDDTLFRLVSTGSGGMEERGYVRVGAESIQRAMPSFGKNMRTGKDMTADQLWQIIAYIRSKNPDSMELVDKPAP